ncbi:MAG TPA: hypothetical protein VHE61_17850, partial [Opitutaceae bacterium]|nr:hypothetical protein [Opitutaceae bacterium]
MQTSLSSVPIDSTAGSSLAFPSANPAGSSAASGGAAPAAGFAQMLAGIGSPPADPKADPGGAAASATGSLPADGGSPAKPATNSTSPLLASSTFSLGLAQTGIVVGLVASPVMSGKSVPAGPTAKTGQPADGKKGLADISDAQGVAVAALLVSGGVIPPVAPKPAGDDETPGAAPMAAANLVPGGTSAPAIGPSLTGLTSLSGSGVQSLTGALAGSGLLPSGMPAAAGQGTPAQATATTGGSTLAAELNPTTGAVTVAMATTAAAATRFPSPTPRGITVADGTGATTTHDAPTGSGSGAIPAAALTQAAASRASSVLPSTQGPVDPAAAGRAATAIPPSAEVTEKIAAAAGAVSSSSADARKSPVKPLLAQTQKGVTQSDPALGIGVAKTDATMPAGPMLAHPNATVPAAAPVAAPAATSHAAAEQALPQAIGLTSTAHRAVEAVLSAADRFAAQDQHSVNLQFSVGGSDLNVRVELRAGEVHTTFRTDSPDLRNALSNEWQAVNAQSGSDRSVRLAQPVFTSSTQAGTSFSGDGSPRQNHASNQQPGQPGSGVPSGRRGLAGTSSWG